MTSISCFSKIIYSVHKYLNFFVCQIPMYDKIKAEGTKENKEVLISN